MGTAVGLLMTGGWRPFTEDDVYVCPMARRPKVILERDEETDAILGAWTRAVHFRRLAGRALCEWQLTFAQWVVLVSTERAVREAGDAVSQQAVAVRTGMDEAGLSKVMARLDKKAFVDIGPDGWGWSYRVIVTAKGRAALEGAHRSIARVAAATLPTWTGVLDSKVGDGGAAEGFDGDFGEELGGGEDAQVGEVGFEELADVAPDVGLGEHDGADVGSVIGDGSAHGGEDVAGCDGGEGQEAAGGGASNGATHALFDVGVEQEDGELAGAAGDRVRDGAA